MPSFHSFSAARNIWYGYDMSCSDMYWIIEICEMNLGSNQATSQSNTQCSNHAKWLQSRMSPGNIPLYQPQYKSDMNQYQRLDENVTLLDSFSMSWANIHIRRDKWRYAHWINLFSWNSTHKYFPILLCLVGISTKYIGLLHTIVHKTGNDAICS